MKTDVYRKPSVGSGIAVDSSKKLTAPPDAGRRALPVRIFRFYMDGFRGMGKTGRQLWLLIIIKLIIIFLVFKIFFFPDILSRDYDSDQERGNAVRNSLLDARRR